MIKQQLRNIYNEKRTAITHSQKEKLDDLLLIQFQKLELPLLHSLMSFWPMAGRNEINTHIITDFIFFRNPGMQLTYPVTDFSTVEMKAIIADDDTVFQENKYGIAEPTTGIELQANEIEAILLPMLVFDKNGYRVGYGRGFYDRFLAKCASDILKIGLCYFEPIEKIEDINEFDIKMDLCVTPENIYEF
ncbi:5-formyltetrahydrofolate cyclo-ligase [Ferruginibacter albus]|uniref:5-formyltetrahydrofolate cyclo-ligase n=1 Tax=Ferruginibacter albus TaxID=2875540 RepID=UPI001CC480AC|nr:5-formyltetrahydrofolate cyclo-ligase [Ferruginibacter albus]UAY50650.1 5-formyltetrahydrofolate cyclo-ligase [Ferruginibacter albus]